MENNKQSDSLAQQEAEVYILKKLNEQRRYDLKSQKIELSDKTHVKPDGYDEKEKILCEIYARIGVLKSAQKKKLASDILKMLLVEKNKGYEIKKILCFASEEATKYLYGNSWLSYAIKKFDIEIKVIELSTDLKKSVLEAQESQKMVNQNEQ